MRAGVQEGDRIVKVSTTSQSHHPRADTPGAMGLAHASLLSQVNGTMVTNSSHLEVVKLIKCEWGNGGQADGAVYPLGWWFESSPGC